MNTFPRPVDIPLLGTHELSDIVARGVTVAVIMVVALVVYLAGKRIVARLGRPKYQQPAQVASRAATARSLLLSTWKYAVVIATLLALLAMLPGGIPQALAFTAVGGVMLAFAAQALLRDVIAGFSVLIEGQFAIGDRVRLFGPDVEGVVEGIGLRITVLREDGGTRVFVPNGSVTAVRVMSGAAAPDEEARRGPRRSTRTRPRPRPDSESAPATASESAETRGEPQRRRPAPQRPASGPARRPESEGAFEVSRTAGEAKQEPEDAAERAQRASSRRRGRRGGRSRSGGTGSGGGRASTGGEPPTREPGASEGAAEPASREPGASEGAAEPASREPRATEGAAEPGQPPAAEPERKPDERRRGPQRERAPEHTEPSSGEELSESPWSIE